MPESTLPTGSDQTAKTDNPDPPPPAEYKGDYDVAFLSLFGILGFIFGCLILFENNIFNKNGRDSVFHEIGYNPRALAESILIRPADSLLALNQARRDTLSRLGDSKASKDSADKFLAAIRKDTAIVLVLQAYTANSNEMSKADTTSIANLNKSLHFSITPATIDKWQHQFDSLRIFYDTSENRESADTAVYVWADTAAYYFKHAGVPFPLYGKAPFKIEVPSTDLRFITKYPAAGTWLLLILIFSSFAFITVPVCFYFWLKITRLFKDNKIEKLPAYLYPVFSVIIFGILFLLAKMYKSTFYDSDTVLSVFFMQNLDWSLQRIMFSGYIAGAFCLGGFVYTSGLLGYIEKDIAEKEAAAKEEQKAAPASEKLAVMKEEKKDRIGVYIALRKYFDTFFLFAAIILSLLVLCTGGLYNTVNSLDFVKSLSDDWGYSLARPDFIYLYGGLYTVILLLVYIPAKMRFNEITIPEDLKKDKDGKESKWVALLKGPFASLKDTLIAVSPLLVSLVQSLFDTLFNK